MSDSPTYEYLPVVLLNGREWGSRELIDICRSYELACRLGEEYARNVGVNATFLVLRRTIGPWEGWAP